MFFKTVIGIDPGEKSGSFAVLNHFMGMIVLKNAGRYSFEVLKQIVEEAPKPLLIALEKSQSSPQMGVSSAFTYGACYGRTDAQVQFLLNADVKHRVQMVHVHPASWKAHCGLLRKSKNDSIRKAKKVLSLPESICLNHHEADAALIAWTSLSWQK